MSAFTHIHRVAAESFPNIFVVAKYLLVNGHANPGDVVVMMRGTREIARGEVTALASLAVSPSDKGKPPPWLTHRYRTPAVDEMEKVP